MSVSRVKTLLGLLNIPDQFENPLCCVRLSYNQLLVQRMLSALFPQSPKHPDVKSEASTENDETEFAEQVVSPGLASGAWGGSKIKKSLCKNFMATNYCPYGLKCQFAHGAHELRINTESNRSYKTRPCYAFLSKGFCLYGLRCNFIHATLECHIPNGVQKWKAIRKNHREIISGSQSGNQKSSRLLSLLGCE